MTVVCQIRRCLASQTLEDQDGDGIDKRLFSLSEVTYQRLRLFMFAVEGR